MGRTQVTVRAGTLEAPARPWTLYGLVGHAPAMQALFGSVRAFAPYARVALITGETGTGKGRLAQTMHLMGPRRGGPFVNLKCTATTEADRVRAALGAPGPSGEAGPGEGTAFLDDVDELPWAAQSTLLELLESADRHNGRPSHPAVHVIGATCRDLHTEVQLGRFRADVLYRLNVVELHIPPLRERLEDIGALAGNFVREIGTQLRRPPPGMTTGAIRLLQRQPWPGNLRELRNVLERACILSADATLDEDAVLAALPPLHARPGPWSPTPVASAAITRRLDEEARRAEVRAALARAHGNKSMAARQLGVSRRSLYRLMDRLREAPGDRQEARDGSGRR